MSHRGSSLLDPGSENHDVLQELLPSRDSSNISNHISSQDTIVLPSESTETIQTASHNNAELGYTTTLDLHHCAQEGHEFVVLSNKSNSKTLVEAPPEKPYVERKIATRLGCFLLYTNVAAFILLSAAVSAVTFLWFGKQTNQTWRRIMLNGWIGQAVTLSSLAVRFAAVTQSGAAVALLASISIEAANGVLLKEAPAVSILRYTNTGPVWSALTFWKVRGRNVWVLLLIGLLIITTSVLHFTSTILLWDVRSGSMRGFAREKNVAVGISMDSFFDTFSDLLKLSPNYFTSSPTGYPTFAEWTQRPDPGLPEHISDTGPAIRGLLPIANEDSRSNILEYTGIASLFDARVICVRPKITGFNYSFVQGFESQDSGPTFHGTISPGSVSENIASVLWVNDTYYANGAGIYFQCSMNQFSDQFAGRTFKFCVLRDLFPTSATKPVEGYGRLVNRLDPTLNSSSSKSEWSIERTGSMVLFFDVQGEDLYSSAGDQHLEVSERKIWLDFVPRPAPGSKKGRISVTSCYSASYPQPFDNHVAHLQEINITATRETTHSEPIVRWDSENKRFDTTQPRNQLGVLGPDVSVDSSQRGILKLNMSSVDAALKDRAAMFSPEKSWKISEWPFRVITGYNYSFAPPSTYSFLNDLLWSPRGFESQQFEIAIECQSCRHATSPMQIQMPSNITMLSLPAVLNATITDIMLETEDPARAWQALMTMALRAGYYDWLPTFSTNSTITTTSMESCQLPVFYRGFIVVMVNLAVHLLLVIGVFVWFMKVTRYTLVNDVWQVVASLKVQDIDEVLDGVAITDDKSVNHFIKTSEGLRKRRIRIG